MDARSLVVIRKNERIDDLQINGLKIIQNIDGFCFGLDAVLISNFAKVKKNSTVVDLGTGTGIISLLVSAKSSADKIYAVEVQEDVADMASRSVRLNKLESRIKVLNINLKNVSKHIPNGSVNTVISNPPYIKFGSALVNPNESKAISRHEVLCTLEDVISAGARLLCEKGEFYMVHRPSRLVDIIDFSRKYGLEPKLLRFVYAREGDEANIVLIKLVKSANPELKVLPALYVYKSDMEYTDEIFEIYSRVNIDVFDKRGDE